MDVRFQKGEGPDVFTGNELLFKGALEAGCSLLTGYPGSPISEFFDTASSERDLLRSMGMLAELANNEALAVARLNGARMAGARSLAAMKSVGLHVAADGLALGNLAEPRNAGGSLVIVGDDPWIESTQINNDSRFLSQHLHMPVLEPATFQELKDWIAIGLDLSCEANLYLTYLVTTPMADGGGTVWAHPNRRPRVRVDAPVALDSRRIDLERNVLLPPRTWDREKTLPIRFETLLAGARAKGVNALFHRQEARFGFVTSGLAYAYLVHALRERGLEGRYPILKLGITYPVDPQAVLELAGLADALVVVEEKRAFLETQTAEILRAARQDGRLTRDVPVWGKRFPHGIQGFPAERGLHVSIIADRLGVLLSAGEAAESPVSSYISLPVLPARTPTFCPGCPHRDSSSVFLDIQRDFRDAAYMRRAHRRGPTDLIFHGETGCFTMLMFEPNQPLMHNYSGMGIGGGTGAGADPFITNKQVVFLGDSTFFHSGLLAVSDALKNGQDITFVILDNKTTAMTGHQPTPGTDLNLMGERTYAQNIEAIVRAMAGRRVPVTRMDPGRRDDYRALLERTVLKDGVKVVIADKECGLVVERRARRERKAQLRRDGFIPAERRIQINADACEFCMACTQLTGCPGLGFVDTPEGPKMRTDPSLCVTDGACAKIQACPAFEEVTIVRTQPPRPVSRAWTPDGDGEIPLPDSERTASAAGVFYLHIAGVGGQGAGLLSSVLVEAAHADGWRVLFSDKKGLAVRNGVVYSQLVLTRDGGPLAPMVPWGQADVVLGLDALEALRSADARGPLRAAGERTRFIVNAAVQPTVRMLTGRDRISDVAPLSALDSRVVPGGVWSMDLSEQARQLFGDTRYVNLLLLGAAFQRGVLPLTVESLEQAIRRRTPREEREINVQAFREGRVLAVVSPPGVAATTPASASLDLERRTSLLARRYGPRVARRYRRLAQDAAHDLDLEGPARQDLERRLYDLVDYGGVREARRYLRVVRQVAERDRPDAGRAATQAALANAYRVMAIKDEFFVARLLTRDEKYADDHRRLGVDPARGDRVVYRHFNRPELVLFGRRWRIAVKTRDWQLRLFARLSFLRRWWPGWHRDERAFRDWYLDAARQFEPASRDEYDLWVSLLRLPEDVRGYRERRYPLMDKARLRGEALLRAIRQRTHDPASA